MNSRWRWIENRELKTRDGRMEKPVRLTQKKKQARIMSCLTLMEGKMIKKFRKKPIVIEAFQLTASMGSSAELDNLPIKSNFIPGNILIFSVQTLEGIMRAKVGDYIIKGVRGEFYPVKEDIFKETYEDVTEEGEQCR